MISIIIPTYNRSVLLTRAVNSVLSQTYLDWELLIIDDGSTDNTRDVVGEYVKKDNRVKYFYKENGGQGSARNIGLKNVRGTYVAFLDSDDEWLSEKLEKQVSVLDSNVSIDFCFTADLIKNEDLSREFVKRYNFITPRLFERSRLCGRGFSVPSSYLFRKTALERVGFFDENRILIGLEDNDWGIRTFKLSFYYIDDPLTIYWVHSGQITNENMSKNLERQISGLAYILLKNKNILLVHSYAAIFRLNQLTHLCLINRSSLRARQFSREALSLRPFSFVSLFLFLFSFFPYLYNFVIKIKNGLRI